MDTDNPTYDEFARARIWLAVLKIKKNKKLTLKELAAQIQAHTEYLFDRRYFGRIRDGTLGNDLVHQVVVTIDARFIPGFAASVFSQVVQMPGQQTPESQLIYIGPKYLDWNRLPTIETFDVLKSILLPDGVVFRPELTEINVAQLPFSDCLYLYRVLSHQNVSRFELFFLSSAVTTVLLDGVNAIQKLNESFSIFINKSNVFDYVLFYCDYISDESIQPVINIPSLHAAYKEFDFDISIDNVIHLGVYPKISQIDEFFQVRFLSILSGALFKTIIEVDSTGIILTFSNEIVSSGKAIERTTSMDTVFSSVEIGIHENAEILIHYIDEQLSLSETGNIFKRVCEEYMIDIVIVHGTRFNAVYCPDSMDIFITAPKQKHYFDEYEIIKIIQQMRFADQELIGHTASDPTENLTEYATIMHSKALDAIIWACKFIKDMFDEIDRERYLAALDYSNKKLYKSYINNASEEELFDIYAET